MRGQRAIRAATALAGRQHSHVKREQLVACGLSQRAIDGLVGEGWLQRVHLGVYAVGAPRLDDTARWMAATLATSGVLSHRSAAEAWRLLPPAGGPVHVSIPTRAGRRRRGIEVHAQSLARTEITRRERVPVTTLVRTLIDVAATEDDRTLAQAFEQAQVRYRLKPVTLATAALNRVGHRGTGRLRPLLAEAVDPGEIESVFEIRFLRLCRDETLERPETQTPFGIWRVDFFFPRRGLVVETDGRRFHATAAARRRDARKTAYLESLGLVVLRVAWRELRTPAALAARIRDASSGTFSPEEGGDGPLAA